MEIKITVTCDCGKVYETDAYDVDYKDTTRCKCGRCHGESHEIQFGQCPKCFKSATVKHGNYDDKYSLL